MAKVKAQGEVIFKVQVEVEVEHTMSDAEIEEVMLQKAIDNWQYSAEHEVEIDCVDEPDEEDIDGDYPEEENF